MVAVADIVRRHGPAERARGGDRMPHSPLAALPAMAQCRTAARGGPVSQCQEGNACEDSDHAGTHRPCPTCQPAAPTRGLEQPRARRLPVPDCLVTCPWPEALRSVTRSHQQRMDPRLVQTAAAALQALACAPHALGGPRGRVGGLHPWTRDLASHPHVHALVPGGALSPEGMQGLSPRSVAWLLPVRALSRLCRGTGKAALTAVRLSACVSPPGWQQAWVTHCQPAGTGTEGLPSFAPDISRSALTTNRVAALEDGQGTCRVQPRNGAGWKRLTLPAEAFIHRVLQHGLPRGGCTVRAPPDCPCAGARVTSCPSPASSHAGSRPGWPALRGTPRLPRVSRASPPRATGGSPRHAPTPGRSARTSSLTCGEACTPLMARPHRTAMACAWHPNCGVPLAPPSATLRHEAQAPRDWQQALDCSTGLCVYGPAALLGDACQPLHIQTPVCLSAATRNCA
jgi:hypothetical protein